MYKKTPDINLQDREGNTPLHVAVEKGQQTAIETLIDLGADTSILNFAKMAPVHLAVDLGLLEPLRVSLVNGFYLLSRHELLFHLMYVFVFPSIDYSDQR